MQKNSSPLKYIFALLAFFWIAIGILPLVCYNGESMRVIHGATILYNQGYHLYATCAYHYETQPLVTALLVLLKFICPIFTIEQIYCLLSAVAALIFGLLSIRFVERISGHLWQHILVAAVLIPETYACAMYPNPTILAATFFIGGLLMWIKQRHAWAILLLGIAPLLQSNVITAYPVLIPLIWCLEHDARKGFIWAAFLVATTAILFTVGGILLHSDPAELMDKPPVESNFSYTSNKLFTALSFYTIPNLILVPWGIWIMLKQKKYPLLTVALVPMILIHVFFNKEVTGTRHFIYLIPFVMLITTYTIEWMAAHRRTQSKRVYGMIAFIVFCQIVSVRADMPMASKQWMNQSNSSAKRGPLWTLYQENSTRYHISVGLGAGQLIPTNNEYMLFSGNLFYPFYIHQYKRDRENRIYQVTKYLTQKGGKLNLVTCSGEGHSFFINSLLNNGFQYDELGKMKDDNYNLVKRNAHFSFAFYPLYNDKVKMQKLIEMYREKDLPAYLLTMHENEEMLASQLADEGIITRVSENLYRIKD